MNILWVKNGLPAVYYLPGLQWGEYKRNWCDCFSISCSALFILMPGLMAGQGWSEPCNCVCATVWVWTPPAPSASAELRESLLRLSWKRNGRFHTEKPFFSFKKEKKNIWRGFLPRMSNSFIKKEAPSRIHSQCSFSLFYLLCHIFVFHLLVMRCISPLLLRYAYFGDLIETCTNAHWSVLWGDKAALMHHTSENCQSTQSSHTSCLSLSSNKQRIFGETGPASSRWLPHYRGCLGRTGEKQMRTDWL